MSKKILVIDDDMTLIKLIQPFLEAHDFKVFAACDGQEGLVSIKENKPDLIILDVLMPKMNGYTFLLEAQKMIDLKKIPIIVLTIKEGMEDIFIAAGVKEYVAKPFNPDALLIVIKKYLK